jgi:hypothetical protein
VLLEIGRVSVRDEAGDDALLEEAELVAEAMGEADPPPFRPRVTAPVPRPNPRRRHGPAAQGNLFG